MKLRRLHGRIHDVFLDYRKKASKFCRIYIRNQLEKKRLKRESFSLISNTCLAGVIYHDMGHRFQSPTINLYIRPCEFVRFCAEIKRYLDEELVEVKAETSVAPLPDYPVALLGDITLYCKHDVDFAAAKKAWDRRKKRIDWEHVMFMMTDRDFVPPVEKCVSPHFCGEEVIHAFSELPYPRKVCLVKDPIYCEKYSCCRQVTTGCDQECVGIITNIVSLSGKRMYQCVRNWDYIDFINAGEKEA